MRALAAIAAVAIASPAVAMPCPVSGLEAKVMTPADAVIEDGGGIIVRAVTGANYDPKSHDVLHPASWRLVDGRARDAIGARASERAGGLIVEVVAPGLAVYRVPAGSGAVSLVDGDRTLVTVQRSPDRDASLLPAPMPVWIGWSQDRHAFRGMRAVRIFARLIGPAPRGAVAMVAFGADGKARSWGDVSANATDVVVFASPGPCQFPAEGVVESRPGEQITVAWLDASGRLSARSAPVEIVER
jgi:hypothetical protein